MANLPQPSQPDPDELWSACDEQPPGVSIRPLGHGDLQALLTHLHHQHDDQDEGLAAGSGERERPGAGRWWRCWCGRASAAPAPPPTPSTDAGGPPNAPAGPAACPGGLGPCWPPAWPPGCWPPSSRPTGLGCWRWRPRSGWAGGCGSGPAPTPWPGGAGPPGSGAPPGYSPPWSAVAGRCCTTWPSPAPAANIDHLVIGPGGVLVDRRQAVSGAAVAGPPRHGLAWSPPARLGPA